MQNRDRKEDKYMSRKTSRVLGVETPCGGKETIQYDFLNNTYEENNQPKAYISKQLEQDNDPVKKQVEVPVLVENQMSLASFVSFRHRWSPFHPPR
jgi:hypothetical protein